MTRHDGKNRRSIEPKSAGHANRHGRHAKALLRGAVFGNISSSLHLCVLEG